MRGPIAVALILVLIAPGSVHAAGSLDLTATYDVDATLRWKSPPSLTVDATVTVSNPNQLPATELVFNLAPLRIGAAVVRSVTVDGIPASYRTESQTLFVDLAAPLGHRANVRIAYRASLEPDATDRNGYFRKQGGVIAAARWIPWLSRAVAFDRPTFGNPFVTGTASRVDVRLTSDRQLTYATGGQRTSVSGLTQTFVAYDVRDFNFAAAPDYIRRTIVVDRTPITLFYRDLPPDKVTSWARRAFEFYSAKVGRYPWPALTIAETGGPKALESPAHVWIPADTRGARLPYLVAHEIAHQWFYGVVGNDQPAEPFADEAPAELLTRLATDTLRPSECPSDTLDRSIYEYEDRCYYETIYVQGAHYLNDYRLAVGDATFWRGIRRYYDAHRFRLAGTRALLDALDAASGRDGRRHATRFPRLYAP